MPDISILISTRNRCEALRLTLAAIGKIPVPDGLSAELIVVDNGSTDATPQVVQEAAALPDIAVRYVREERTGLSNARNAGVATARGDLLLFTDDDIRPSNNWIADMSAPLRDGRALAVVGSVHLAPHLVRPWMNEMHRSWLAETVGLEEEEQPSRLVGANMGLHRDILRKIPSFDPELGAGALGFAEETLFSLQMQELGYKIWPAFSASVEHHPDPDRLGRASLLSHALRLGRSSAYIEYHWWHKDLPGAELACYHRPLRLALKRLQQRGKWPYGDEGLPEWEMLGVFHIGMCQQFVQEKRGGPRKYDLHGCIKRSAS